MSPTSKCPDCGSQATPGAKFCRSCGGALEATSPAGAEGAVDPKQGTCPACFAPVPPGASFCRSCGERQPGAPPPKQPPPPPPPRSQPPPPPGPQAAPPQAGPAPGPRQMPVGAQPGAGNRGPLIALVVALACLALGGLVFGGAYLLTRDDGGAEESIIENGSRIGSGGGISGGGSGNDGGGSLPASPTERGFPTDSEPAMRAEAEELLRDFHMALVESDFRYAWSLLSSRKRRQEEDEKAYSGWKEAQATLTPYLVPDGIHVEIDELEGDGVARVLVTGMGWTQPGSPCSEWSGLTWVRYEGGAWRRDPGYSTTAERRREWEDRSGELLGVGC